MAIALEIADNTMSRSLLLSARDLLITPAVLSGATLLLQLLQVLHSEAVPSWVRPTSMLFSMFVDDLPHFMKKMSLGCFLGGAISLDCVASVLEAAAVREVF